MNNFYKETDVAVKALNDNTHGLIEAATGTGKGVVIQLDASKYLANHGGTIVIVGHRILLTAQLMQRVVEQSLKSYGSVPYRRIGVHSGDCAKYEINTLEERIAIAHNPDNMCLSIDALEKTLIDSQARNSNNAIYVTYHSLSKVFQVCHKLGIKPRVYFDEIHTAASDIDKWASVENMVRQASSCYALSATVDKYRTKILNTFKQRIFHLSAKDAIDKGLICKPVWMIAEVDGDRATNLAQGVVQAFVEHDAKNKFKVKALVNCKDSADVATIKNSPQVRSLYNTYNDFMLASITYQGGYIDGVKVDRHEWLRTVNNHDGYLMVLHIDICNAGIDVPDFNLPIWTYLPGSETYTVQGNGRGARLSSVDRPLLENGTIDTSDLSKWHKPYNTVCLLYFTDTINEDRTAFVSFILRSREEGFSVTDIIQTSRSSGNVSDPFNNNMLGDTTDQDLLTLVNIALEKEQFVELVAQHYTMNPSDIFATFTVDI